MTLFTPVQKINNIITELDCNDYEEYCFTGRSGSEFFEEKLKDFIRTHSSNIIDKYNTTQSEYQLITIDAEENTSEAAGRTMHDIRYIFHCTSTGDTMVAPINVKATTLSKKSADNVGGWSALSWVLFGCEVRGRKQLSELIKNHTAPATYQDYYLWVFDKNTQLATMIPTGKTYSLLSVNIDSLKINHSQSFPLQFACHDAHIANNHPGTTERRELALSIFQSMEQYYNRRSNDAHLCATGIENIF